MAFSPSGALLRYYVSKHFNARVAAFPLGTFFINMLGTIVEGICMDLQHSNGILGKLIGGDTISCSALQGVVYGFCGCATTVSTWVVKMNGLRIRHSWIYEATSIGFGLALQMVLMGTMIWTAGYDQPCVATSK